MTLKSLGSPWGPESGPTRRPVVRDGEESARLTGSGEEKTLVTTTRRLPGPWPTPLHVPRTDTQTETYRRPVVRTRVRGRGRTDETGTRSNARRWGTIGDENRQESGRGGTGSRRECVCPRSDRRPNQQRGYENLGDPRSNSIGWFLF